MAFARRRHDGFFGEAHGVDGIWFHGYLPVSPFALSAVSTVGADPDLLAIPLLMFTLIPVGTSTMPADGSVWLGLVSSRLNLPKIALVIQHRPRIDAKTGLYHQFQGCFHADSGTRVDCVWPHCAG